jgi:hypothetical protein
MLSSSFLNMLRIYPFTYNAPVTTHIIVNTVINGLQMMSSNPQDPEETLYRYLVLGNTKDGTTTSAIHTQYNNLIDKHGSHKTVFFGIEKSLFLGIPLFLDSTKECTIASDVCVESHYQINKYVLDSMIIPMNEVAKVMVYPVFSVMRSVEGWVDAGSTLYDEYMKIFCDEYISSNFLGKLESYCDGTE